MNDAIALLGLHDDEFAECIMQDSSITEWLFREMKTILKETESDEFLSSKTADKLLLVAVRIVASENRTINVAKLVDRGALSIARIVAMCSLYAQSNDHVMQWWIQRVCERAPLILEQIPMLHDVLYHALLSFHFQVASLKAPCLIEATQIQNQLVDVTKTIYSLLVCSDAFLPILTGPHVHDDDLGQSFDGQTLLHALLVCYENDLPILNSLCSNDTFVQKTRRYILTSVFRWINGQFLTIIQHDQSMVDVRSEQFFGLLNSLLHNPEAVEPASLLSDLCQLFQLKSKCKKVFQESSVDTARIEYLTQLLSGLPERARPVAREITDGTNPNVVVGGSAQDEKAAVVLSIMQQVKEIFPDLGDGFLELCIQACDYSSDKVIMALLEDNLPDAVAHLDRSLSKNGPNFSELSMTEAKQPQAAEKPKEKADPAQIWVGKKKQAEKYVPESVKADKEYLAKQQMLAKTYEEEPFWQATTSHVDEYNDDYNDELEEYEPFGVHDDEPTDYEEIIARNKAVRAQEAEDAFWESMRNRNHAHEEENEPDDEEGNSVEETSSAQTNSNETQKSVGQQQNSRRGQKTRVQTDKRAVIPEDPKKQAINRARKEQNKSSVANHRRKDKALKKQGGGMF